MCTTVNLASIYMTVCLPPKVWFPSVTIELTPLYPFHTPTHTHSLFPSGDYQTFLHVSVLVFVLFVHLLLKNIPRMSETI